MNVLVTAGATREPIDAVRFISNVSTGATGAALADALAAAGHAVVLLRGEAAVAAARIHDQETFSSAADLAEQLRRRLATGGVDAVVMGAAVSDFHVADGFSGKISSALPELRLRLVRNPKLLPQLKSWSPRPLRVIGFKLTVGADAAARRAAVTAQFAAGGVDAVVHNDLVEIRAVARAAHPFRLFRSPDPEPELFAGVPALAAALSSFLAS